MSAPRPQNLAISPNGNPLPDISNTRRISGVFAQGRYYSRQDLDGMLASGRQIAQAVH